MEEKEEWDKRMEMTQKMVKMKTRGRGESEGKKEKKGKRKKCKKQKEVVDEEYLEQGEKKTGQEDKRMTRKRRRRGIG